MATKGSKINFISRKSKNSKRSTRKIVVIESEESDSSDSILSDDDDSRWNDSKRTTGDLTPDYHNIQKLVKYVKAGNTTATMISLCCLKDYDLTLPINRMVSSLAQKSKENFFLSSFLLFGSFFPLFYCLTI